MTLIVDAGPLVSMAERGSATGQACHRLIQEEPGEVVLPAYVAAEADYLILSRLGAGAERLFLRDLASGAYSIEALTQDEQALAVDLDERYPGLGLADLSMILLAARHRTTRILTFDERDFRRARPLVGEAFVVLPADEPA